MRDKRGRVSGEGRQGGANVKVKEHRVALVSDRLCQGVNLALGQAGRLTQAGMLGRIVTAFPALRAAARLLLVLVRLQRRRTGLQRRVPGIACPGPPVRPSAMTLAIVGAFAVGCVSVVYMCVCVCVCVSVCACRQDKSQ